MYILGISAFYHDSAAAIIKDGELVSAAQEERFTRKKHDPSFPLQSINFCLKSANISLQKIDYIVFYDKPFLKFERLIESYLEYVPRGLQSFVTSMPLWIKEKIFLKQNLKKQLAKLGGMQIKELPPLLFNEHHRSHAASAFYPSPFAKAAVLCLDGVGEWATSSVWLGENHKLTPQWQIDFPHSIGLLYSAFTSYTGFKVNSGEYKVMGLAPYGQPKYTALIYEHLIDLKADGTFKLNMDYFGYTTGLRMTNRKFHQLFGGPPRDPESQLTQKEMDLACSIQAVTEEVVLRLARTVHRELQVENLCLAGGVALNCVANGRLLREGPFKNIWIQPAAGDSGGSLGAAYSAWYEYLKNPRMVTTVSAKKDEMQGSFLGPDFSDQEIQKFLEKSHAPYLKMNEAALTEKVAELLTKENVIGWFQGRMEFGPRALGNRSILGDPRSPLMQSKMNLKIKFRESFRPFAPAIKKEKLSEWFCMQGESPYMLMVAEVIDNKKILMSEDQKQLSGIEKLNVVRSSIPAVTHLDYSARVQTVDQKTNKKFYNLLHKFEQKTGCPILINTSFNVRGEPIVCTPEDAYRCFMNTGIDFLVLGNYLLAKSDQPVVTADSNWMKKYELD